MAVTLTEAAAERARRFLASDPGAVGIRFGVRRSGCSGFAYEVDLAGTVAESDRVFESRGVRIIVDEKSLPVVEGTVIDFDRTGLNEGFVYRNPNTRSACGCGESFAV